MSCLKNIDKTITEQKDLYDITQLYQFKGKDFYYNDLFKKDIKSIINETIFRECKAIVDTFGLEVTPNRLKLIVKNDSEPKNDNERFLRNARDLFKTFANKNENFELALNQYENISKQLFHEITKTGYKKHSKIVNRNLLQEVEEYTKRNEVEGYIIDYKRLVKRKEYELISLIAAMQVDLIKTDALMNHTDIVNLFWLYGVLYKEGFYMFRYVSFFEIYNLHKDEFADAVTESQINWERGYANAAPLAAVIRRMMIEGYRKVDDMIRAKEIHITNRKTDLVEIAIMKNLPEVFTKDNIRELLVDVSTVTIDRTLERLRKENKIRPNGTGRSATWQRLVDVNEFDEEQVMQTNIFQFLTDEEIKGK